MRRSWGVTVVVAALVVAGACSDGREGPPGATVPPGDDGASTSAPATTLSAAAYEVPEVIDQAYVQKVVSAYDKVLGDAIRILVRDQGVSEEFLEHLLGIYTEPEFDSQHRGWREAVAQDDLRSRPDTPGDPVTLVVKLERADEKCITAEVDRDFRPTLNSGVDPAESEHPDYVVLVRKKPDRDPLRVNPTPWVMAFDGFKQDGSVPVNSCED